MCWLTAGLLLVAIIVLIYMGRSTSGFTVIPGPADRPQCPMAEHQFIVDFTSLDGNTHFVCRRCLAKKIVNIRERDDRVWADGPTNCPKTLRFHSAAI